MTQSYCDEKPSGLGALPMNRRGLLRAAVVGAGTVAFGGFACTSNTPAVKAGSSDTFAGVLANPFRDLDPTTATSVATYTLNNLFIYEGLYRQDPFRPREGVAPELALDMPRQITPTRYRINLREGAVFHDGSPLTAEDVVFTIQRMKDPATKSFFGQFLGIVKLARVIKPRELELELTTPTTLLPERLSLVRVLSKKAVAASPDVLKLRPVGSGPYQVVSAVSEQKVTMSKFAKYSGKREITYKELRLSSVTDPSARVSSLRTGQSKVIEDVPPGSVKELSKVSEIEVKPLPGADRTILFFHCGKKPFGDARVRRAVLYAIDRDSIASSVYFGQAEPAWDGEVMPVDADYAQPSMIYRYDPAHAKQLLAAAGYAGEPIPIDLIVDNDAADRVAQAPIIEQNLKDVGFAPNIIPMAASGMTSRIAEGNYHAALTKATTANILATADFHLRFLYYGGFVRQLAYWNGPATDKVERLLDEAQAQCHVA